MRLGDLLALAWEALRAHRLRTRMTYAAIAIGFGAVLLLTALGEGGRAWIVNRFATLGTSVLIVLPGRTETRGGPPMTPATTRDVTLDDMIAVQRRLPGLRRVVPLIVGEATAEYRGRGRTSTIIGTSAEFLRLRGEEVERGTNLPDIDVHQGMGVCVIGRTIQRELFGEANPLGENLKVGDHTFRVIGLIAQRGQEMMVNLDDLVIVPVASGLRMFNRTGLFRLVVEVSSAADLALAQERVTKILKERHDDEEDFTILTPGAVAASLSDIINMITAALAGIAAISLLVAGIGVMNVMIVSVTERKGEIGLMKVIGASNGQVLSVFLVEAMVLSMIGAALGIAGGLALTRLGYELYPTVPFRVPEVVIWLAAGIALVVGIGFGIAPAVRAARLEPLDALRRKV